MKERKRKLIRGGEGWERGKERANIETVRRKNETAVKMGRVERATEKGEKWEV